MTGFWIPGYSILDETYPLTQSIHNPSSSWEIFFLSLQMGSDHYVHGSWRQPACCWLQGVLPECVMAGLYLLAFHVKFRPCLGSRQTVFRLWQCTSAFTWKFFKFCTQLPFWFVAKRWGGRNHLKPRFHFCQVLIIKSFNLPNAPEQSTIIKSSSSNV